MKCWEVLEYLHIWRSLEKGSAPRSWLVGWLVGQSVRLVHWSIQLVRWSIGYKNAQTEVNMSLITCDDTSRAELRVVEPQWNWNDTMIRQQGVTQRKKINNHSGLFRKNKGGSHVNLWNTVPCTGSCDKIYKHNSKPQKSNTPTRRRNTSNHFIFICLARK